MRRMPKKIILVPPEAQKDRYARLLQESRNLVLLAVTAEDQAQARRIMSMYFKGEITREQAIKRLQQLQPQQD